MSADVSQRIRRESGCNLSLINVKNDLSSKNAKPKEVIILFCKAYWIAFLIINYLILSSLLNQIKSLFQSRNCNFPFLSFILLNPQNLSNNLLPPFGFESLFSIWNICPSILFGRHISNHQLSNPHPFFKVNPLTSYFFTSIILIPSLYYNPFPHSKFT